MTSTHAYTPTTPFRRFSLWLISLLMGLLALGPFLHAHYGASLATGFHVNGLQAASVSPAASPAAVFTQMPQWVADTALDRVVFSPPTEQDSPAVGVATTLPRFEADSFSPDVTPLLLLSVWVLCVVQRLPRTWPWTPAAAPTTARYFKAGFPPPAHAPPLPL